MHRLARWSLALIAALVLAPRPAAAVATNLEVSTASEAVPQATLQIFDMEDPATVVEERDVDREGIVVVDLDPERSYGVRIKGGPVLAKDVRAGQSVRLAIPAAFTAVVTGWRISAGAGVGGSSQEAEAEFRTIPALVSGDDDEDFDGLGWAGDFEVMAPPCDAIPGAPRFFVHSGATGLEDRRETVVSGGIDGTIALDVQGKVRSDWFVGLGFAVPVSVFGHEVCIKPSVNYGREKVRVRATLDEIGTLVTDTSKNHTFEYVRPQLEVETPFYTGGGLSLSFYASGSATFFVGDDDVDLRVTGAGGSARYRFEKDDTAWGGHAGLRISWSPDFLR